MVKILFLTLLLFAGMVAYDSYSKDPPPPPPPKKEAGQEQTPPNRPAGSVLKGAILALAPPQEQWPEPVRKFYTALNLAEVVEPIRHSPNWTSLRQMSPFLPTALVAIEDHAFYQHGALALSGVARAALSNLMAGQVVEGGSTITQQLVKNIFLSPEQTVERKVYEALLSLKLEEEYSKDEILELYLNTTYFGAGANGIKQAAATYFNKAPRELSLGECAVIAALPYAPSALNPLEYPEDCRRRQRLVLNAMLEYGFINQQQLAAAKEERIHLANGRAL